MEKDISVIIPQGRKDIAQCVETVKNQTVGRNRFEIVVVRHPGLDQKFDKSVRVVTVPKNSTTLKRNTGVEVAKGKLICFIDDDVLLPKNFLENTLAIFDNTSVDIAGGPNVGFQNQSFQEYLSDILLKYSAGNGMRKKFIGESHPSKKMHNSKNLSTCNLVIPRQTFLKLGGFNKKLSYGGEDTEFLYRAEKAGLRLQYDAGLSLWHQRREFPRAHMRQLFTWGKNNGKLLLFHPSLLLRSDFFFPPIILAGSVSSPLIIGVYNTVLLVVIGELLLFGLTLVESKSFKDAFFFVLCFPFHFLSYTSGLLSSYVRLPFLYRKLRKV